MATKRYPLIAREGWGILALIALVALALSVTLGMGAGIPVWLIFGCALWMFRDPTRVPPSLPLAVVSPVHGKVTRVAQHRDPWLERESELVALQSGLFDIRSIYSPTEGKIMRQWHGAPIGSEHRQHDTIAFWIQTDELDDVVLEISRRGLPGPMKIQYSPGERVGQGRRVGYVNNGCLARIYLPAGTHVEVSEGQSVQAGSKVIGNLVHLTRMANGDGDRGTAGQ